MNIEIFLEQLLTQEYQYTKIGRVYIKENYWFIIADEDAIEGYVRESDDNRITRFFINNWRKLNTNSLSDVLLKNKFI